MNKKFIINKVKNFLMVKLSIILPTYNERKNIVLLIDKILVILKSYKKL